MIDSKKVKQFVDQQQTLQFYEDTKHALSEVLKAMNNEEFAVITNKLCLVVLHEGPIGQVIHFNARKEGFAVLQLTIPDDIPYEVLRWSIAHELGHVLQNKNWQENYGDRLEDDATARATKWGFVFTDKVKSYLDQHRKECYS
jgi:hypothetical protein